MDAYEQYRLDVGHLAAIGREIVAQPGAVIVSLPLPLARLAVQAWNRDHRPALPAQESPAQFALRSRAGSFALVGLAIESVGYTVDERMTVALPEDLRLEAVRAARETSGEAAKRVS